MFKVNISKNNSAKSTNPTGSSNNSSNNSNKLPSHSERSEFADQFISYAPKKSPSDFINHTQITEIIYLDLMNKIVKFYYYS